MRILTRYVLFDLLKLFLLTLTGLTLLIFVVLIGKEAVDKGVGLGPLWRMTPYLLPQAMQFAVPGTMLLATTSVYGRMAAYNEIVAIKSLGISPMALVWPTLALATLVSFGAVWINDLAVSWGTMGVKRVFLASMEEVIYGQLRMKHSHNMGKANIIVRDVDGHRLIEPRVIIQSSGDKPAITVSAKEAELRLLPEEGKLLLRLHDYEIEGPMFSAQDTGSYSYEASIEELTGASSKTRSPSNYALGRNPPGGCGAAGSGESRRAKHERAGRVRNVDWRFRFAFHVGLAGARARIGRGPSAPPPAAHRTVASVGKWI